MAKKPKKPCGKPETETLSRCIGGWRVPKDEPARTVRCDCNPEPKGKDDET